MIEKFTSEQRVELNSIAMRASDIHKSVSQEYDGKPYSYHLFRVSEVMDRYFLDLGELPEYDLYKTLYFACMFHDSIEDARLTYNDVLKIASEYMTSGFAKAATEIVYALTNEKGRPRKERANSKYYQGICDTKFAPFIKACDRMANIQYAKDTKSRMFDVYKKEMKDFLSHISDKSNRIPKKLIDNLNDIIL